jgi:cytochrome b pre-mRNA-processing protein 3
MIWPFSRGSRRPGTISTLYGTIVAQARLPCFYRDYGVPDTIDGRFDLLVVHLSMVLQQFELRGTQFRELGQGLFDQFCRDMDHNLREIGIGDLSVPKEMNRIGEAFYGRSRAYSQALAREGEDELAITLARNVFGTPGPVPMGAFRLAAYMRRALSEVARLDRDAASRGEMNFPNPAAVPIPKAP